MDHVMFRPASPDDSLAVAQFSILAGGGIFEFLLEDFLKDNTLENILASEIEKETGSLSYLDTEVAELNSKIIGIINSGDAKEQGITQEMIDFYPSEKLNWLQELFSTKIEGSLYVYILAVDSHYRKQGIGKNLMNHVKNKARKQNISSISLTVWSDNIDAIKFYKKQGFKEVKQIKVDYHPLLPHHGGIKLMQCILMDS
ncbi:MAG: GNAT family N-acetyltransferase [Crocosphaera sp.]